MRLLFVVVVSVLAVRYETRKLSEKTEERGEVDNSSNDFQDGNEGRMRRSADDDYNYDDYDTDYEGVPNLNLDVQFPINEELEFDTEMPKELILNLNIYLDPTFKTLHGSDRFKKAKQIIAKVSKIYQHPSLVTKMKIVHNNRIFDSDEKMTSQELEKIAKNLRFPFHTEGIYNIEENYKVVHLYFTAQSKLITGRGFLESLCDKEKESVAVIRWKTSVIRTSMTAAHEIGHVIGMYHDFKTANDRRNRCAVKNEGVTLMNYGKSRTIWSNCSNEDFQHYYERVITNSGSFCLEETPSKHGRSTVPWKPCGCNGEADVVGLGGKCGPTGWCYVDEDMACGDMSPYNRKNISREACPATTPPCVCNGQTDFVGNGGSCQDGPKGAWCYVDGEADCDNINPYNGNFISMSPCTGRATTSCAWGVWSSWGSCSATCGGGSQGATRNVDQQATNGGQECKGSKKRSQECGMKECPTDCSWSAWSSWSSCSATCGGGSQYTTRHMAKQAIGGGEVCEGEPVKIQQCGMNQCGYLLTSSGEAAEHAGGMLGLYDEIKHEYAGRVFKQRGGSRGHIFIYKKDDKWLSDLVVGRTGGWLYSYDLFSKPGEWYYNVGGGEWQNNDPTLQFLPLTPSSCILQPSIQITSTGPALTRQPDYLGTFLIVQDVFYGGRPVWRNSKGKVLMMWANILEDVSFVVFDGIPDPKLHPSQINLAIRSASAPTCPTDTKAGHSDRYDENAWLFRDGEKWVEDNTITVQ